MPLLIPWEIEEVQFINETIRERNLKFQGALDSKFQEPLGDRFEVWKLWIRFGKEMKNIHRLHSGL